MTDEAMPGGRFARPVRRGETVEREAASSYPYVHEFLRHLEVVGFGLAPRYLGMTPAHARAGPGSLGLARRR